MTNDTLAARTEAGFAWMAVWRMATRLLGFASTLLLVRLLNPADFGLMALATSAWQAIETLTAAALDDAVVRLPHPGRAEYDTAWTLNLLRAALIAALIALLAVPLGGFFEDARLAPILWLLALASLSEGAENIGVVEFRRDLSYDRVFRMRIVPRIAGILVTIALALTWRSYWAMVAGILVTRLATCLATFLAHPYRPRLSLAAWRKLAAFSLWLWASGLVSMLRDRGDTFIIGRMTGAARLGVFVVAAEIASLPASELIQPFTSVLFSAFSRTAHDDRQTASLFLHFLGLAALLAIPAGLGIALLAEPLTLVLLGGSWRAAVPLIQLLATLLAFTAFGAIARASFEARGLMARSFALTLLSTAVRLALVIFGVWQADLWGAALGGAAATLLDQAMFFHGACRMLGLRARAIAAVLWRPALGGLAMGTLLAGIGAHRAWRDAALSALVSQMALTAIAGAVLYAGVVWFAWALSGRPDSAEARVAAGLRAKLRR